MSPGPPPPPSLFAQSGGGGGNHSLLKPTTHQSQGALCYCTVDHAHETRKSRKKATWVKQSNHHSIRFAQNKQTPLITAGGGGGAGPASLSPPAPSAVSLSEMVWRRLISQHPRSAAPPCRRRRQSLCGGASLHKMKAAARGKVLDLAEVPASRCRYCFAR